MDLDKLRELRQCPSGDAGSWRARYERLIAEELRHREVPSPKVSVIVVAYQSAGQVIGCLEHVRAQRGFGPGDLEIILVDNGGLESARPRLPALVDVEVRMTHNVGLCPARNLGAALARGPVLSFIDDDGLIEPDYYEQALAYLEDPRVHALRSRIVYKEHRYFTTLAGHYDRGDEVQDDNLITEGSSVIRRDTYFAIGGFADNLSPFEGMDLSYRLKGYYPEARILYAPKCVMHHDYCDSFKKLIRKSMGYRSVYDIARGTSAEVDAFLREHGSRRYPEPALALDEKLARGALGILKSSLRFYSRLRRKDSSYIPVRT